MITHDGKSIPTFPARWDPSDRDWIYIAWDDVLDGAIISTSTWTLPTGWTEHDTRKAVSVTDDDGSSYSAANGVEASTTSMGVQVIANKVVLSDGREYERSVRVVVIEL